MALRFDARISPELTRETLALPPTAAQAVDLGTLGLSGGSGFVGTSGLFEALCLARVALASTSYLLERSDLSPVLCGAVTLRSAVDALRLSLASLLLAGELLECPKAFLFGTVASPAAIRAPALILEVSEGGLGCSNLLLECFERSRELVPDPYAVV